MFLFYPNLVSMYIYIWFWKTAFTVTEVSL